MELKPYQKLVLDDLTLFLENLQKNKNISSAFSNFWSEHPRFPLQPLKGQVLQPYNSQVKRVPHVCLKVPTAGGKTFIASNAIKTIFDAFDHSKHRAVVWLVPSDPIFEQTYRRLSDPSDPYRQKINIHFGNKVEVYDKESALSGSNFNATSVKENLSIFVLSIDSLRRKNKDSLRVHYENGNLFSFQPLLGNDVELSLMSVISYLNPVVIVDESHNVTSGLSIDMLESLNPSFILDLTATPRDTSNIISFVDAFELKRENMVKLPVIVYNHKHKKDVIASAIQLRRKLEHLALENEKQGGKYIRPIILFQAESKSKEDTTTFQKVKDMLITAGIPEEEIKIKTATINEIKGIDLMARDCLVRYIITINALKEGWDCPFAYVLASLADRSSAVDVEQILGRVLRQPHVSQHISEMLNMSYVLTASSKFLDTLDNIVKGLNRAGFSSKDYRLADETQQEEEAPKKGQDGASTDMFSTPPQTASTEEVENDGDIADFLKKVVSNPETIPTVNIDNIENIGKKEAEIMSKEIEAMGKENKAPVPTGLASQVGTHPIKDTFKEQATAIKIPQFVREVNLGIFGEGTELFEKTILMKNFPLSSADTYIDFKSIDPELYKVDLNQETADNTPSYLKVDGTKRTELMEYILSDIQDETRVATVVRRIKDNIGSMHPIPDIQIEKYLTRIFQEFTTEQYMQLVEHEYLYSDAIKSKIKDLADSYILKEFRTGLDKDQIDAEPRYSFPSEIRASQAFDGIIKSLYEKEATINKFEREVINEVANLKNIAFWTRNIDRQGFCINGFINHYPDFIIVTKSGYVVLLETKGDHLDAEKKIELGKLWEAKAGKGFKYYLVYNERDVKDAYRKEQFLDIIKDL